MKRLVTVASLVVMLVVAFTMVAWAKGPARVFNTIHNLSTEAPPDKNGVVFYSSNTTEVCVFCHTPHGGRLEGPLWNRNLPAATGAFTHYSSSTLSNAVIGASGRAVGDESRLCLSCHDGSATLDHLVNPPNELGATPLVVDSTSILPLADGKQGGLIGNLTDDHPISFSYDAVHAQALYGVGGGRAGQLHTVPEALVAGVRFFGSGNRVECSSCHDPHVDYSNAGDPDYAPFLITPNGGSNLCLACHNK